MTDSDGRTDADAGTDHVESLYITDSGGTLPLDTHENAHVFETGSATALCGHGSTADHDRSVVREASHDHNPIHDHRVCRNCARAVRSRIAGGELTSGHDTLDRALRIDPGDELSVGTDADDRTMTVTGVEFAFGSVKVEGTAVDPDPEGIEHYTDTIRVWVDPEGRTEAILDGDLCGDREREGVTLHDPTATDGGTGPQRVVPDGGIIEAGDDAVILDDGDDPDPPTGDRATTAGGTGTGTGTTTTRADPAGDVAALIDRMEAVDWRTVPTISTAEAAAWTARLERARDTARDRREGRR